MATPEDDWRAGCSNINEILSKARKDGLHTDIKFIIGADSKVFKAHKFVLACGSPRFRKMFYGEMPAENSIVVEDENPEKFDKLLGYIYGEDIKINSFYSCWECYTMGEKYSVPWIVASARDYVDKTNIDEKNVWEIIDNGLFFQPLFEGKVKSYIEGNADSVLRSEKFINAPGKVVESILHMSELNTTEYQLLFSVTQWGYKNIRGNTQSSEQLLPLLNQIRFSNLEMEEFFKFMDEFPEAIDIPSSLQILKRLHNKDVYHLPDWCSSNTVSRHFAYEIKDASADISS